MKKTLVKCSKDYTITISRNLSDIDSIFACLTGKKVLLVSDTNVFPKYGQLITSKIPSEDITLKVIKAGEKSKNFKTYYQLINTLAKEGFTRSDYIIALGGGVVGDISGFAASTYMRGLSYIQIPTTILSMVDSSVGGKTAIDLPYGKNLCGTFYQPSSVFIYPPFTNSLPTREIMSGFGELVKYAMLSTTITKEQLKSGISEELIYNALKIKADIVEKDEYDNGVRALLNLGHTFGHAIEQLSRYKLSHGECVVIGLSVIITISQKVFNLSDDTVTRMRDMLNILPYNLEHKFSKDNILNQIHMDKKSNSTYINLVLLKDIGNAEITKIAFDKLKEIF